MHLQDEQEKGCASMITARIELQKQVYVLGEEVTGAVYFSLDEPASYTSAKLSLIVKERTWIPSYYDSTGYEPGHEPGHGGTVREEKEFLHQDQLISLPTDEKGKIKAGEHDIHFSFALPLDLPPSYEGEHGKVSYAIVARVDTPNGSGFNESWEFKALSANIGTNRPEPIKAVSDNAEDPKEASITFNLERNEFSIGENVDGRYSYRNPNSKYVREIKIRLKCEETDRVGRETATTDILSLVSRIPIRTRSPRGQGSFSIQIPQDAPASLETALINVRYVLTTSLPIAWRQEVRASEFIRVVVTTDRLPLKGGAAVKARTCQNCQKAIMPPYATYCSNCGAALSNATEETTSPKIVDKAGQGNQAITVTEQSEECMVCGLRLKAGEDVVWCPYCGNAAHRAHLIEWIHSKHTCPICIARLLDADFKRRPAS